jgi:hypothetical protein
MDGMDGSSKATTVGGGAILGAMITGITAFGFAAESSMAGHFEAAGVAFLAAAVAFRRGERDLSPLSERSGNAETVECWSTQLATSRWPRSSCTRYRHAEPAARLVKDERHAGLGHHVCPTVVGRVGV